MMEVGGSRTSPQQHGRFQSLHPAHFFAFAFLTGSDILPLLFSACQGFIAPFILVHFLCAADILMT